MTTEVILVDSEDNAIGTMEKMEAHEKGLLHRAFSVLIFNSKGQMLLQKRARSKYHSGGLWTNTCCSHPAPNESVAEAAKRRLKEEMGIDAEPKFDYKFTYKTPLDQNLVEHEVDHVFTATFDGKPVINTSEVEDWKFVDVNELLVDISSNPQRYTEWFKLIVQDRYAHG
ncbi:MAG: isopentenyl-diphosphate Delta-isomerase [Bacteroidetes bacterium]|nr:isopentenyl-diphosphate Delta-isomerase [Bacteroidota bacterium]